MKQIKVTVIWRNVTLEELYYLAKCHNEFVKKKEKK